MGPLGLGCLKFATPSGIWGSGRAWGPRARPEAAPAQPGRPPSWQAPCHVPQALQGPGIQPKVTAPRGAPSLQGAPSSPSLIGCCAHLQGCYKWGAGKSPSQEGDGGGAMALTQRWRERAAHPDSTPQPPAPSPGHPQSSCSFPVAPQPIPTLRRWGPTPQGPLLSGWAEEPLSSGLGLPGAGWGRRKNGAQCPAGEAGAVLGRKGARSSATGGDRSPGGKPPRHGPRGAPVALGPDRWGDLCQSQWAPRT